MSIARALSDDAWAQALAGMGAVAGHVWPVWLGFRGGRGVSAAYGSLLAMNPLASLACLPMALLIIVVTRYMSLMSVSMAPIAAALFLALAIAGCPALRLRGLCDGGGRAHRRPAPRQHSTPPLRRERKIGQKEPQRTGERGEYGGGRRLDELGHGAGGAAGPQRPRGAPLRLRRGGRGRCVATAKTRACNPACASRLR